jgi:hypothetical protein
LANGICGTQEPATMPCSKKIVNTAQRARMAESVIDVLFLFAFRMSGAQLYQAKELLQGLALHD